MTTKTKKAKWVLEGQYGNSLERSAKLWIAHNHSMARVMVWRDGDETPAVEVKVWCESSRRSDRKKAWAGAVKRAEVIAAALNEAGL